MAKTPEDRSSDSSRIFGGPGRTQRTEKFDAGNPIHEGIARLRDEAYAAHQPNPNPNSHITYKKGGSITIPLPGDYSEHNLPKPKEKRTRITSKKEPVSAPNKPQAKAPAKVAPAPQAEKPVENIQKPGQAAKIADAVAQRNAAIREAKKRKNNGL
jgi:hypothetical protein